MEKRTLNVLNIMGSPRKKGTSARIAASFTEAASQQGAEVEHVYLGGLDYKGCQGCEYCHSTAEHCVLKDELKPVLDAMRTADITVFSSPVYFGDVSGQFKSFFDRTWSHVTVDYSQSFPFSSRLPEGKTAVLILSQGDTEQKHLDVVERYSEFLTLYGYDLRVFRVTESSGAPDADVSGLQQEAAALAKQLVTA